MRFKKIIFFLALFFPACVPVFAECRITVVLCENKVNPLGVPLQNLHFNWELDATENGQYQTASQLVIASSKENLQNGKYDVYNSSVVKNAANVWITSNGFALLPGRNYFWKLRVWDKKNKASAWSSAQKITTGLFENKDWSNAKWIGYEALPDDMRVVPGVHQPASKLGNKALQRPVVPLFRKEITARKKIKNALLFITGLGQYEASINGSKIGNAFLSPGWTYYDKRVLYNTFDITDKIVSGKNVIGAIVGNGFFNINRERYYKMVAVFGMPQLLVKLKIEYEDGSVENIVSDTSWKTAPSPITFSSIYGGEDYDARLEQKGWNTVYFDDAKWKQTLQIKEPKGILLPEQDYPVELMETYKTEKIYEPSPGIYVYDFGKNMSGIVQLKVKGKKGQTVELIPSELIDKKGMANQDATGKPYYFSYTLKGDGEETWQPKFTYYGFRYVMVKGAVNDNEKNEKAFPEIVSLQLLHNRNSNPVNGTFECSNRLFNRIDTLINRAIKSNMQSVLTDCPHREKLSWLEEDHLMGASIHYNFDIHGLYRKLVFDLIDAQYEEGFIPDIAPEYVHFEGGFLDSPEWGSSGVILPWLLYKWYGDKDILVKAYPMMKKYVAYLKNKSNNHILSYGLGDWFDYGPNPPGYSQLTPNGLTATAIYYYDVSILHKTAKLLNSRMDENNYSQQQNEIKKAFNTKYFDPKTKVYATGSQTSMAMPLSVGLVEESDKKAVLKNLTDSVYATNKALTAGDVGFHYLIDALDQGGASQLIYEMNNRDDVPGYGFQLKRGATTLTESWPALENVSNNHLMLGHIMEWFYSALAGIGQMEGSVAYKHIRIRPQPVGDISFAKGSFHSPYGWITSSWKKETDVFVLNVHIPVNTKATVYLPANISSQILVNKKVQDKQNLNFQNGTAVLEIGSGDYEFEIRNRK
jgi:alpha-L-rhamnosidase